MTRTKDNQSWVEFDALPEPHEVAGVAGDHHEVLLEGVAPDHRIRGVSAAPTTA
jgi:hypothetical protein